MLTVAARTSIGKSCFALQLAYDCAKQGLKTHLFSLEMSAEDLLERLFCQVCRVPNYALYNKPSEYEKQATEFITFLKDLPLIVTYKIGSTAKDLANIIDDLPSDVIIVDYIQAIQNLNMDRMEAINNYILHFREVCVKKNMAGVLVSQINRGAMESGDKRPQLWYLKASGVIEEHSDQVVMLHYPYFYTAEQKDFGNYEIIIGKNRNGITGNIPAKFEGEYYLISEEQPVYQKTDEITKVADFFDGRVVNAE
jgi:replicative DNA helicase